MSANTVSDSEVDAAPQDFVTKEKTKRAREYKLFQSRPNIHQGLHLADIAFEYGTPNNCNVLLGEDKHRYVKIYAKLGG
jgi:hypothetical protein